MSLDNTTETGGFSFTGAEKIKREQAMFKNIKKFISRVSALLAVPFMLTSVQAGAEEYRCYGSVWLRSEPDSSTENQIGIVHNNEIVSLIDKEYGWGMVEYTTDAGDSLVGWTALYLYEPVQSVLNECTGTVTEEPVIFEFLTQQLDFNMAQAKAVMTNIYFESRYNPTECVTDTNGLTSYGICQWNGVRFEQLKTFCNDRQLDYTELRSQLAFLAYELEHGYSTQYEAMKVFPNTAQGCYDAAYYWAEKFEVCASAYWTERAESAYAYYNN